MKRIKAYKCSNCEHLTTFKSFWKWLFTGIVHIDFLGIRWFKCPRCGKYVRHQKVKYITESKNYTFHS